MENNDKKIISLNEAFRFKCIRCDYCCGTGPNVSLTIYDIIRLSYALDVDPHVFLRVYTKVIVADVLPFIVLRGDSWGRCVFLGFKDDGTTYCKKHLYRPMKCRFYPLILKAPYTKTLELDLKCPGINEEGEKVKPSLQLYKQYSKELKNHYRILYKKVILEGKDAVQALDEAVESLRDKVKKKKPYWIKKHWLKKLDEEKLD